MIVQDILYVAMATILVMTILQITTFMVSRILYPPEPKIIYRDAPVQQYLQQPPPVIQQQPLFQSVQIPTQNGPALTQTAPEVQ